MDISFEEMREEFLPKVREIYNYYVLNSTATFHIDPVTDEEMREIVYHQRNLYRTFVILDGQEVCGYCIMAPFKKREAYDCTAEITVYLSCDYSGKGVGSLAVKHIEQYARERGIHSLIAIICGENIASIKTFEKNGYEKCAYYKEVGMKFGRKLDVVCHQKILGRK